MDNKETKLCKYCQSEIPKKAKVCPNCRKKQGKGIIKWILIVFVAMLMFSCVAGGDEEETLEKEATQSNIEENENIKDVSENSEEVVEIIENKTSFEYADMKVDFVEYKIEENSMGEQCLVLYFDFTNNREESQAFGYTFTVKAFQDGVELEPTFFHVNEETENSSKEIKTGVTLRVAEQYGIEDISGNIVIEIEPFNIWSDRMLFQHEFSLD